LTDTHSLSIPLTFADSQIKRTPREAIIVPFSFAKNPHNFTLFVLSLAYDTILAAVPVDSANLASQWAETVREEKEKLLFFVIFISLPFILN
jgi:hypothetical protein